MVYLDIKKLLKYVVVLNIKGDNVFKLFKLIFCMYYVFNKMLLLEVGFVVKFVYFISVVWDLLV